MRHPPELQGSELKGIPHTHISRPAALPFGFRELEMTVPGLLPVDEILVTVTFPGSLQQGHLYWLLSFSGEPLFAKPCQDQQAGAHEQHGGGRLGDEVVSDFQI